MDVPLFCQKGEGDSGTVTGCLVNKVRVTVHQGTVPFFKKVRGTVHQGDSPVFQKGEGDSPPRGQSPYLLLILAK